MKNLLPAVLLICLLNSCDKNSSEVSEIKEEKPIAKKVVFEVFSQEDYSKPEYAGTPYVTIDAEVNLLLERYNIQTLKTEVLWDTIITRRKQFEFPLENRKMVIEKNVNVLESKETLYRGYSVKYNSSMGHSGVGSYRPIANGETLKVVKVIL